MKHKIDASNKILGRLACEIAVLLRGKNEASFLPHRDPGNSVEVVNARKVKVSGNKLTQKAYFRYSGYPGGIKEERYEDVFKNDPALVVRRAVYGMLPPNKLRARLMRRLVISK